MTPRLAFFISGRGSNMDAILRAIKGDRLNAVGALVVSNKADAPGLEITGKFGIPSVVFDPNMFASADDQGRYLLNILREYKIDFIVLAGYLRKIPAEVVRAYHKRIVNIHPALLPKYGGKGMYGLRVHEAVLAAGDTETGVTIHWVTEEYDEGAIIAQEKVKVNPGDTPEILAERVLEVEHRLYPEILNQVITEAFNKN